MRSQNKSDTHSFAGKLPEDFNTLARQVLSHVNRVISRVDFLREVSKMLIDFSGCDSIELWLKKDKRYARCRVTQQKAHSFEYETNVPNINHERSIIGILRTYILSGKYDPSIPYFTGNGSILISDTSKPIILISHSEAKDLKRECNLESDFNTLALIPLKFGDERIGLIQLMSKKPDFITEEEFGNYENFAEIFGIALVNQRTQAALRERVKELTCLYSMARLAEQEEKSNDEILKLVVDLIPPAWQYPDITAGRIVLDGQSYTTPGFRTGYQKQMADIIVKGMRRGTIEVTYTKLKPILNEGPFLSEERSLLEVIARQVALIVERRESKEDSTKLQEQLRHADRLATIGQLAAGIAHELNEPLGNILGFAQLIKKSPTISGEIGKDNDKIIDASLYAREVIKKLMIFARQMPPKITRVRLNRIVDEGLFFFEARCAKAGIELVRSLSPDIPEIVGDQAQLNQVLINLVVNSIQAMPDGGKLTIRTCPGKDFVSLVVEDTGIGMSKDVIKKIFLPFFTTKDVDEGTGLGLAVVHGIVTSHKGTIEVKSYVGRGARFEVQLPVS